MKREETYPNYSVYMQDGGQLKIQYSSRKRVKIYDLNEARVAACNVSNRYKQRVDVLILKYTGPYDCGIVQIINRKEKDGSTPEHIL